jgi:acetoin utilization protein AcuB
MAVDKIMTTGLITVSPEHNVEHMQNLLNSHAIHHLLVVENGSLLGVISDRDILRIISPFVNTKVESEKDRFTLTRKAHQIMRRKPITIKASASLRDAARSLVENKISLLPVVDEAENLVGVLSWKDVMRYIME